MAFLENHGKNIQLSNQNLTAARVSSYNQGLLVTAQPLARQQLFQVTLPYSMRCRCFDSVCQQPLSGHQFQIDRLNPSWTSSLSLGVIGHSPDRLNFPSTACCLKRSAWLLQRDSVFHNSLKVNTRTVKHTESVCRVGSCLLISVSHDKLTVLSLTSASLTV